MSYDIDWIETEDRFSALACAWNSLAASEPTPFADHTWFQCWWKAFGKHGDLRICTLWRDADLAAVLPLAADGRRLVSLANYHSPLFRAPARNAEALERVMAAALDVAPDELKLHGVPVTDATSAAIRRASRRRHRIVLAESQHVSPIVSTRGDFTAYTRDRKSRLSELLRRRRKLAREHDVRFVLDDSPPDIEGALDAGFALEAVDWKLARGSAIVSSPQTVDCYRRVAHAYRARGDLRLVWLYVDGRAAAFGLVLKRGSRLFLLKQGFDTALRKAAPGLILVLNTVEWCFEAGCEAYELLGQDEPWKKLFATDQRAHERIWSFRLAPVPLSRYAFRRIGLPVARAYRTKRARAGTAARPVTMAGSGGYASG
jgi:CelD/BcsL family acetyltransferase involved in cellulose biosynthesis